MEKISLNNTWIISNRILIFLLGEATSSALKVTHKQHHSGKVKSGNSTRLKDCVGLKGIKQPCRGLSFLCLLVMNETGKPDQFRAAEK